MSSELLQYILFHKVYRFPLKESTGCGLVRALPSVFVLAPVILKQFSKFRNPLHNESKLVLLFFIKKIK